MEGALTEKEVVAQRRAIEAAQSELLTQLSGTEFKIVRVYDVIPGIALEVGNDALAVLGKSNSVSNVLPDRPINPAASPADIEVHPVYIAKTHRLISAWFQPSFFSRQPTPARSLCWLV
jgi:hypothetical protein